MSLIDFSSLSQSRGISPEELSRGEELSTEFCYDCSKQLTNFEAECHGICGECYAKLQNEASDYDACYNQLVRTEAARKISEEMDAVHDQVSSIDSYAKFVQAVRDNRALVLMILGMPDTEILG